jgi:hypothetical protein
MLWTYPNPERQGGFLDMASGSFTADPQSVMVFDNGAGLNRTPGQPYLYGTSGDSVWAPSAYDQAQHRWLPVPPQWVSPDGSTYAYSVQGQGVHLVNVASALDRVVPGTTGLSAQVHYSVVGYTTNGVYLTQWGPTGGPGIGLWRLDPVSNAISEASTDTPGIGVFVGETALESPPTIGYPDAWWNGDPLDPHVYHQYLTGAAGQHGETWFQRPGFRMKVIGVDTAGRAIVVAQSASQVEVWLLATPNSATQLYAIANTGSSDLPFKTAVANTGGWWIGSQSGVYFATATGLIRASTTPAVVVGGCV